MLRGTSGAAPGWPRLDAPNCCRDRSAVSAGRRRAYRCLPTAVCLPLALLLRRVTGVPRTYPPLSPLPILSGTVGGALLTDLGYGLLMAVFPDPHTRRIVFLSLGLLLLIASFHLPYRLSYTKSPRFAGVTPAAQISQGVLHILVVVGSMLCFRL